MIGPHKVCARAFKLSHRTAWMLGSDQTLVDMGIMAFKVRFKSGFQMERLLLFCFICGVLGLGESVCFKYFGGWTRKSYGFMEVFENHRVASCGGPGEESLKEVTGVQILGVACQVWLGPEHAHLIALSNYTSSNSTFSTLSPTPSSTVHSHDSQGSSVKGKIVIVKMMTLEDDKSETSTKLAEAAAEDAGKKLMT
nr:hypothetical protein CFP56_17146 [Quercus suber]